MKISPIVHCARKIGEIVQNCVSGKFRVYIAAESVSANESDLIVVDFANHLDILTMHFITRIMFSCDRLNLISRHTSDLVREELFSLP